MKKISKVAANSLEESIGWLSNYTNPKDETHFVGENRDNIDAEATEKLRELGNLNSKRKEILEWFKK